MTTTYDPPATATRSTGRTTSSRGWALAGTGAGVAGIVSLVGSSMAGAVYDPALAGDAAGITAKLAEQTPQIMLFHTATMVSALLMVVFAAGLQRRLVEAVGTESCFPPWRPADCCWWPPPSCSVRASRPSSSSVSRTRTCSCRRRPCCSDTGSAPSRGCGGPPAWPPSPSRSPRCVTAPCRGGWGYEPGARRPGAALRVSPLQYMAGLVGPIWLTVAAIGFTTARAR